MLATALDLARTIRKTGVVSKVCYGFIGNRMMDPYGREAERCVQEGATPQEVDDALEVLRHGDGDPRGLRHGGHRHRPPDARGARKCFDDDPTFYRPVGHAHGTRLARSEAGRGYYRYEGGKRQPDPEVVTMLREEARRLGVPQRNPDADEIRERCLYGLINEGARILEEGVALRASDIDVVYTAGYGFPRWRGGPMFYADSIGLKTIYDRILEFQRSLDPPLLATGAAARTAGESQFVIRAMAGGACRGSGRPRDDRQAASFAFRRRLAARRRAHAVRRLQRRAGDDLADRSRHQGGARGVRALRHLARRTSAP